MGPAEHHAVLRAHLRRLDRPSPRRLPHPRTDGHRRRTTRPGSHHPNRAVALLRHPRHRQTPPTSAGRARDNPPGCRLLDTRTTLRPRQRRPGPVAAPTPPPASRRPRHGRRSDPGRRLVTHQARPPTPHPRSQAAAVARERHRLLPPQDRPPSLGRPPDAASTSRPRHHHHRPATTKLGYSQQRIAALTSQPQPEVSAIIHGRTVMAYDVLNTVRDSLDAPRGYLDLACCTCKSTEPETPGGGGEPTSGQVTAGRVPDP